MPLTRRTVLFAGAGSALAAGCAQFGAPHERIVEVASGRTLSRAELLAAIRASEFALLGEQHDNRLHHRRRGELLAALPASTLVVAEHLALGSRFEPGAGLLPGLVAAGFDPKGWDWPLHEPLFAAVVQARQRLVGGNVPRELARRLVREGDAALPDDLAVLLRAAPLDAAAQAALDADLVAGHCNQLPTARLPGMRLAQRARDAAMASALLSGGGQPAVLIAGNGHVRSDYGVPRLLAGRRVVSVGFVEPKEASAGAPYTHLWITPGVERADPCAGSATLPR
jgi:uncharacterized iron-regulated protein